MNLHPRYSNLLQFSLFAKEPNVVHFSTTRVGGVSDGTFSSLNLGNFSDDNPLNIVENRTILARMFYKSPEEFIIPHQTHGCQVLLIDDAFLELTKAQKAEILYGVDATVTHKKDIFICVTTADCVPILLFDRKNDVVAAIHAGWRGTAQRIVRKTIEKMELCFGSSPANMIVGIGPSISMHHCEVGKDVEFAFIEEGFDLAGTSFRKKPSGKIHLDLREINRKELIGLGISEKNIETSELCTFEKEEWFFSARRQTVCSGRMLTGIMIK